VAPVSQCGGFLVYTGPRSGDGAGYDRQSVLHQNHGSCDQRRGKDKLRASPIAEGLPLTAHPEGGLRSSVPIDPAISAPG
jgi:hypothetical protein